MSSFCVYGVTIPKAIEKAKKEVPQIHKGVIKPLSKWMEEVNAKAAEIYKDMKPIQISPEFDAPQFCSDWVRVCLAQVESKEISIMARVEKKNADGTLKRGAKTGAILMEWKPYDIKTHSIIEVKKAA